MHRTNDRYDVITDVTTPTARVWIGRDRRHGDFLSDSAVKVPGGLRTLITRWRRLPTVRIVEIATLKGGALSARPYQLAQACDGSITTCALALFEDFCTARRLDPAHLVHTAYPEERDSTSWTLRWRRELRERAAWEGVAYPETWDASAVRGLVESLHEINHHGLAAVVADLSNVPVLAGEALALSEMRAMGFAFARERVTA